MSPTFPLMPLDPSSASWSLACSHMEATPLLTWHTMGKDVDSILRACMEHECDHVHLWSWACVKGVERERC
jgi:hypothetical protein